MAAPFRPWEVGTLRIIMWCQIINVVIGLFGCIYWLWKYFA